MDGVSGLIRKLFILGVNDPDSHSECCLYSLLESNVLLLILTIKGMPQPQSLSFR